MEARHRCADVRKGSALTPWQWLWFGLYRCLMGDEFRHFFSKWHTVFEWLSAECLLTRAGLTNGGTVIVTRALFVAMELFGAAIGFKLLIHVNCHSWRVIVDETLPWFGATFGAAYASLYTRYASQWTYLANIYHRIKETEARGLGNDEGCKTRLAEWKAGFIEDVQDLHLHRKPIFASVILAWTGDEAVRKRSVI